VIRNKKEIRKKRKKKERKAVERREERKTVIPSKLEANLY
jgi:hypothetical protein